MAVIFLGLKKNANDKYFSQSHKKRIFFPVNININIVRENTKLQSQGTKNLGRLGLKEEKILQVILWHRGVVVITTAQLHSTKPELRFCSG